MRCRCSRSTACTTAPPRRTGRSTGSRRMTSLRSWRGARNVSCAWRRTWRKSGIAATAGRPSRGSTTRCGERAERYRCFLPDSVRTRCPAPSCAMKRFARQPSSAFRAAAFRSPENPPTISSAVSVPFPPMRASSSCSSAVARKPFCSGGFFCAIALILADFCGNSNGRGGLCAARTKTPRALFCPFEMQLHTVVGTKSYTRWHTVTRQWKMSVTRVGIVCNSCVSVCVHSWECLRTA